MEIRAVKGFTEYFQYPCYYFEILEKGLIGKKWRKLTRGDLNCVTEFPEQAFSLQKLEHKNKTLEWIKEVLQEQKEL